MAEISVGLRVGLDNKLSGPFAQIARGLKQDAREVESRFAALAKSGKLSQQQLQQAAISTRQKMAALSSEIEKNKRAYDNSAMGKMAAMMQARATLGIRGEQAIRREIEQTRAAYQTMAQSGVVRGRELARAADASRQKIAALNAELGKASKLQTAMSIGKGAVAVGAGAVAAGAVVNSMLDKPVAFDERLRSAATTAYGGGGRAQLDAGYAELQKIIKENTIKGVTRDQTLDAYTGLAATGQFKPSEIKALLPSILKGALAGDANTGDMVQLASSIKNSGISDPKKIEEQLSKYLVGGMKGQFELRDSAKAAPRLLQHMKALGYSPEQANQELIVMLQQARQGAGTNDQAAVNVENFLAKMQAESTRKDFQKQGVDLEKEKALGRMQGKNPLEIYFGALDKVIAKADPQGRANALLKQYKDADPEKRAALNVDLQKIFENTAVSKIIGDLQEYAAYAAIKNNKNYGAEVRSAVGVEHGQTLSDSYAFRAASVGASVTQATNAKDSALFETMQNNKDAIKGVYDGFASIANAAPGLTGATLVATGALSAFAGVAGIAAIAMGGKGVGLMSKIPGMAGIAAGAVGAGGLASKGAGLLAGGAKLLKGGGLFGLAAGGASMAIDAVAPNSKVGQYASSALSGAGMGAMVGSVVPVIGTAIGASVGALGGLAVQAIQDAFAKAEPPAAKAAPVLPSTAPPPPQTMQATLKVDMSPDLRAQLAQIKASQNVTATVAAGGSGNKATAAIAARGSVFGGL